MVSVNEKLKGLILTKKRKESYQWLNREMQEDILWDHRRLEKKALHGTWPYKMLTLSESLARVVSMELKGKKQTEQLDSWRTEWTKWEREMSGGDPTDWGWRPSHMTRYIIFSIALIKYCNKNNLKKKAGILLIMRIHYIIFMPGKALLQEFEAADHIARVAGNRGKCLCSSYFLIVMQCETLTSWIYSGPFTSKSPQTQSHGIHRQEAERDQHWWSANFLLYM